MSRMNAISASASNLPTRTADEETGDALAMRKDDDQSLLESGLRFGKSDQQSHAERRAAFEKSLTEALQNVEADPLGSETDDRSAGPEWHPHLVLQASVPAAEIAANRPAAAAQAIADLIAQVEARVESASASAAANGLSLSVPLGGEVDGLRSVTVTLSADTLEIVFIRSGAVPMTGAFLDALHSLADRLHARFSTRTVRVVDRVDPSAAPDADPRLGDMPASRRRERSP